MAILLTVKTTTVLRQAANRFLGINLNYIRDADANRPAARPLAAALKDLRARWLRYPGGAKSDYHLWSVPPYTIPQVVSLKWYATVSGQRLNFDQYIATCRATSTTPYVVCGYDRYSRTGITEAQWITHASSWVHYANIVKGYKVRYWEIGNENWNKKDVTAAGMAKLVVKFSKAMKAVDPSILVGAGGNSDAWWATFLPIAAPALNWLTVGLYPCWDWGSYLPFTRSPTPDLISIVRVTEAAIAKYAPLADRNRLRIMMSETNSVDWSDNGWPKANTLGHALVTFDSLGQYLQRPSLIAALVWTTRWMEDAEATSSQFYALDPANQILPTGRALQIWGQFLQANLVPVTGGTAQCSGYASRSSQGGTLTIWIINRSLSPHTDVAVTIQSSRQYPNATVYQLRGTGPDDPNPFWGRIATKAIINNMLTGIVCPGVSITVLHCRA